MKKITKNFLSFLNEEYNNLSKIKLFLVSIPDLIANGKINEKEFQNFLEKYELETSRFVYEKNRFNEEIAEHLNIPKGKITFKLLVSLGFKEFEDTGRKILKISNETSLLLMKISIYLKNSSKLQNKFKLLNNFLFQKDYSARGIEPSYDPGRNFHREA